MRSCGLLRSEWWQFLTDLSGQPTGPIFRGQDSSIPKITHLIANPAKPTKTDPAKPLKTELMAETFSSCK
jgi:hypothetical protein